MNLDISVGQDTGRSIAAIGLDLESIAILARLVEVVHVYAVGNLLCPGRIALPYRDFRPSKEGGVGTALDEVGRSETLDFRVHRGIDERTITLNVSGVALVGSALSIETKGDLIFA